MSESQSNIYANFHKGVSDEEVLEVFENAELYVDDARLAAFKTLKERAYSFSGEQLQIAETLEQQERKLEKELLAQKHEESELEEQPLWYSQAAILGLGVLISPFFGAILLAMNFYRSESKKLVIPVIFYGMLIHTMNLFFFFTGKVSGITIIIVNVVGTILLVEFFWKKYLGTDNQYNRRSIWPAILVLVGSIFVIAFITSFFVSPEYIEQLLNKG